MKEFTIGAWIIGAPEPLPVKLRSLNLTGKGVEVMYPSGAICRVDLDDHDRFASPEEVVTALIDAFTERSLIDVHYAEYDEEEDSLIINGITVYKDGTFIDIL